MTDRTHRSAALATLALAMVSAVPAALAVMNASLRLLLKHPTWLAFDVAFLAAPVLGFLVAANLLLSPNEPLSERSSKRTHWLWTVLIINPAAYVFIIIGILSFTERSM